MIIINESSAEPLSLGVCETEKYLRETQLSPPALRWRAAGTRNRAGCFEMSQSQMYIDGELTADNVIRAAAERSMQIALATEPTADTSIETPFGSGQMLIQEVQPGLRYESHAMSCHSDMEFECSVPPQVSCAITLEGNLDGINIEGFGRVEYPLKQATLIGFGEHSRWTRRMRADQYFKSFCVTLQPAFFERFADNFGDAQLSTLAAFGQDLHVEALPLSQRLITLGHCAFDHSYSGGLATLYQESNTLQFVLEVAQLMSEERRLVQKIGRSHFDRLMHARSILDNSLLAPPKTLDLARQVGTNVTTLQTHFKLALGTTIFGYVKSRRLETGRVLLTEHRLGVAEAAYRVGFTSPSAFSAAYRRHFGRPPSSDVIA